jgi:hypothetical protein
MKNLIYHNRQELNVREKKSERKKGCLRKMKRHLKFKLKLQTTKIY